MTITLNYADFDALKNDLCRFRLICCVTGGNLYLQAESFEPYWWALGVGDGK